MAVGAEGVAQAEPVERRKDPGREALAEALGRRAASLGDDDPQGTARRQVDCRRQAGRTAAEDENVTPGGDVSPTGWR